MVDRRRLLPVVVAAALLAPALAHAHGRPPLVSELRFHPTDPDVIVARGTWGLVFSEDGGASWRWICAAVFGADPTREDPALVVAPDGAFLLGTYDGLMRSTPERCAFEPVPGPIGDGWVIDMDQRAADPEVIWAVSTSGIDPDRLFRSDDGGRSFEAVGEPIDTILVEALRVAPSDPSRIYLSGFVASGESGMREAWVLRSSDGGGTFERTQIALEDGERNLIVLAVDPTDPERLLVRVTRRSTDDRPERLILSEDGGRTFTPVLMARTLSDAAFADDGATVWVTARDLDGLFRSDDGGRTFTQLATGNLPCVELQGEAVWVCADELRDDVSLARSTDGGESLEPALVFDQIRQLPDCDPCSEVSYVCRAWFPDLAYDLRLEGTGTIPDGGVTGTPRDAAPPLVCVDGAVLDGGAAMDGGVGSGGGGCGCRAVGAGPSGAPLALVFGAATLLTRRRGRRGRHRVC